MSPASLVTGVSAESERLAGRATFLTLSALSAEAQSDPLADAAAEIIQHGRHFRLVTEFDHPTRMVLDLSGVLRIS